MPVSRTVRLRECPLAEKDCSLYYRPWATYKVLTDQSLDRSSAAHGKYTHKMFAYICQSLRKEFGEICVKNTVSLTYLELEVELTYRLKKIRLASGVKRA